MTTFLVCLKNRLSIFATILAITTSPLCALEPADRVEQPSITPAKETTYFTEPLDDVGYVDILAAVNNLASEGVTPENNAAVLLWQAYGPAECDEKIRAPFFAKLGMKVPPADGKYFVPLDKFDDVDRYEELDAAMARPWKAKEFPELAKWLVENEKPLALIVEASQRPRMYEPYVTAGEEGPAMVAVLLPGVQRSREVGRALCARAMLHAGEGDFDAAKGDLLALHRIARHTSSGLTLIHSLMAFALDTMAFKAEAGLVTQGKLMAGEFRQLQKQLAELPPLSPMSRAIDTGERAMFIDCVHTFARDLDAKFLDVPAPYRKLFGGEVDWNETLRTGNSWYDRFVATLQEKDMAKQNESLEKLEVEVRKMAEDVRGGKRIAALVLVWGKARSKLLGRTMSELLMVLLTPATKAAARAEWRHRQQLELTQVVLALAAYRAEHGSYPKTLAALAPKYMKEIPPDHFAGAPLKYEADEAGFELYSVGMNKIDDGGIGYEDEEAEGDDLVIRTSNR